MTEEQDEGKKLMETILSTLDGKDEAIIINVLLSCVINMSRNFNIDPAEIILSLVYAFGLPITAIPIMDRKETRH